MNLDEINSILKAQNEKEKRELERSRLDWFHTYRAFGSDVKKPDDIVRFEWEKKQSTNRKLSKKEVEDRKLQAERWLQKRKLM